jgi:hypothetical protein
MGLRRPLVGYSSARMDDAGFKRRRQRSLAESTAAAAQTMTMIHSESQAAARSPSQQQDHHNHQQQQQQQQQDLAAAPHRVDRWRPFYQTADGDDAAPRFFSETALPPALSVRMIWASEATGSGRVVFASFFWHLIHSLSLARSRTSSASAACLARSLARPSARRTRLSLPSPCHVLLTVVAQILHSPPTDPRRRSNNCCN